MASDKQHSPELSEPSPGQILIYKDAGLSLQVRLDGQTVWLTQLQMAELFQTTPQNITLHIQSIYEEREQIPEATCKEYLQVRQEGERRVQRALKQEKESTSFGWREGRDGGTGAPGDIGTYPRSGFRPLFRPLSARVSGRGDIPGPIEGHLEKPAQILDQQIQIRPDFCVHALHR